MKKFDFEVFRSYSDCLYAAYGTKWNGNAAAYNGSLFVVQDERVRRLSPLECERLMGFPDDYTNIQGARKTNRYQAVGNSWAVPVVKWIGDRLINDKKIEFVAGRNRKFLKYETLSKKAYLYHFGDGKVELADNKKVNASVVPSHCVFKTMQDIVTSEVSQDIYLSPVGCHGILRRKKERNISINLRLEKALKKVSKMMSPEDIERKSLVQKRGSRGTAAVLDL